MQKSDNDLGYPAEWGTENFPQPNPYFPDVPRPLKGVSLGFILLVFPVAPLVYFILWPDFGNEQLTNIVGIFLALLAFLLALAFGTIRIRSHLLWRSSRIIPAMICRAGSPKEREGSSLGCLLPPPFGLLMLLTQSSSDNSNDHYGMIDYFIDGQKQSDSFDMGPSFKYKAS